MTVKERVLALKILEKQEKNPEYAEQIGVAVKVIVKSQGKQKE